MAGSFFLVYLWIDIQTDLRFKNGTSVTLEDNSEAYSKPCQTSKMEVFAKIMNGFSFLVIFAKSSILDVQQYSELASEASKDLQKKLHLSCLTGFWITFVFIIFVKLFPSLLINHISNYVSGLNISIVHGQIHVALFSACLVLTKIIILFPNHVFL